MYWWGVGAPRTSTTASMLLVTDSPCVWNSIWGMNRILSKDISAHLMVVESLSTTSVQNLPWCHFHHDRNDSSHRIKSRLFLMLEPGWTGCLCLDGLRVLTCENVSMFLPKYNEYMALFFHRHTLTALLVHYELDFCPPTHFIPAEAWWWSGNKS